MSKFYFSDGEIAESLEEFAFKLRLIDDECLNHHINEGRNDFANWIRECVKDKALAKKLEKLKDKEEIISVIKKKLRSPAHVKKDIIKKIKKAIAND